MKNLKSLKFMAIGLGIFALAPLASCSNEETPTLPEVEEVGRPLEPGEETTITIYIPQMVNQTRATQIASQEEANIKELWFCAYAQGGKGATKVQKIVSSSTNVGYQRYQSDSNDGYVMVTNVNLKEGEYKIYLVANVDDYTTNYMTATTEQADGSSTGGTSESNVQALPLLFSDIATVKKIVPGSIPMVCEHKDIKSTANGSTLNTSNYVLSNSGQKIYADMTMMCSKVRFTILFDNTTKTENGTENDGFSINFKSNEVVFSNVYIDNINKKTVWNVTSTPNDDAYLSTTTADKPNGFSLTTESGFKSVKYPDTTDGTNGYLNIEGLTSNDVAPNNLASANHSSSDKKRAWQGVIYLPENTNASKKTIFNFESDGNSNIKDSSCTFDLTLTRGNFYDVVAKLKTPDKMFIDLAVYVKVNPWEYKPMEITTW